MNGSREDRRSRSRPRLVGEIVRLGPGTYGVPGDEKRRWALLECLGRVMECDLGKRVYDVSEPGERVIYQCENTEQRDARLAAKDGGSR